MAGSAQAIAGSSQVNLSHRGFSALADGAQIFTFIRYSFT
jgi:hypothetical protein